MRYQHLREKTLVGGPYGYPLNSGDLLWIIDPESSTPFTLVSGYSPSQTGFGVEKYITLSERPTTMASDNEYVYFLNEDKGVFALSMESINSDIDPANFVIEDIDTELYAGITIASGVYFGPSPKTFDNVICDENVLIPFSGLMKNFVSNEGYIKGMIISKFANNKSAGIFNPKNVEPFTLYSIYPHTEIPWNSSYSQNEDMGSWTVITSGTWPEHLIDIEYMEQPDYARVLFAVCSGVYITSFENQFSDPTPSEIHFSTLSGVIITDITSARMY